MNTAVIKEYQKNKMSDMRYLENTKWLSFRKSYERLSLLCRSPIQLLTSLCPFIAILLLSGCIATTGGLFGNSTVAVGPESSSVPEAQAQVRAIQKELEVIVPVFDPNIPEDSKKWKKQGIWPELRRVESVNFALKMKKALEETNQLGAVRVTPDAKVTGDIYVIGKINKSNGEDVEINVKVLSIDGKTWLNKNYKHRVDEYFFTSIRNKDNNAYYPVFEKAAVDIVKTLEAKKYSYLKTLNQLTEVRFGYFMSDDSFAQFLKFRGKQVELVQAPSDDAPMLKRIHQYRVEDQLFIDSMQHNYDDFNQKVALSYRTWQEAAYPEAKARREAQSKAALKALAAILLIGVAASSDSDSSGGIAAETGAVVAGAMLLGSSAHSYKEAKFHQETLMELGKSVDVQVAPQVVEFEEKTIELTGDMAEQFEQWRAALKRIYAEERTPDKQL